MFNHLSLSKLSSLQKGMLLALIGYSGFAFSDVSAKFLTGSYEPMVIVSYIMLSSAVMLALLMPWLGGISGARPSRRAMKFHLLRGVMNFVLSVAIVYSFAQLPLATIYAIIFAKPCIAALLAIPFYKEQVPARRWVAIGLGFCGVVIAMRPSADGIDPVLLLPLLAALCSAIMWICSRSLQDESVFAMGFYPYVVTWALTLPFLLSDFQLPALQDTVFFLICGAGVTLGTLGLSIAYRRAPSAAVSPFHYTQIVWGVLFGALVFGDIPDGWTILGAVIIISSGLYLVTSERWNNQPHS